MTDLLVGGEHPSRLNQRVWARVRRPSEMVQATRWLFALLVLVSALICLPGALSSPAPAARMWAVAAVVGLVASVTAGYVGRVAPLWSDITDAILILAFALACAAPSVVLGYLFASLWFRSLYGTGRQAALRCVMYAGAFAATVPLWAHVPGHSTGTDPAAVFGVIPTMFLTVIVGRHLAGILHGREQSSGRDVVLGEYGPQLLTVSHPDEIRKVAWLAVAGICDVTPGLRVMKVTRDGSTLRVDGTTGFGAVPDSLPVFPQFTGHGEAGVPTRMTETAPLDAAAGTRCSWTAIRLPMVPDEVADTWLVVGSPGREPSEAVVSLNSLVNQVVLALRNSEVHRELTVLASVDALTGLVNRASFHGALTAAVEDRRAQPTSVLFVDLDDFKDINDLYGHAAGDELLREVAARLNRATRPGDLAARLGGDEFAVLLSSTTSPTATDIAWRVVQALEVPVQLRDGVVRVTTSVGVATADGGTGGEELVHSADVAMYAAKANGKGRVQVFESGLLEADSSKMDVDRQLSTAVDNGELVVHYQPVLSLWDGRCTAVEALVRWQHPTRGLLYPDAFICAAERTGAIVDIGSYVVGRACADVAAWRHSHPGVPLDLHVNISAMQLDDEHFVDDVATRLAEAGLPAERLVLEITESVVVSSPQATARLEELAATGITLAIDDFGTGYSSLTALRSLPVRIVKIDKSFVAGSTVTPQDRAVTEAVVKMATQMGLRTIAEGVERLDQQRFLQEIGADAAQGFLYLRPTPAAEFAAWLDAYLVVPSGDASVASKVVPFLPRA